MKYSSKFQGESWVEILMYAISVVSVPIRNNKTVCTQHFIEVV